MLSPFGHGLLCLLVVPREQGCEVYLAGGRFTCRKDEDAGGDHDRIEQNANRNQRLLQLHSKARCQGTVFSDKAEPACAQGSPLVHLLVAQFPCLHLRRKLPCSICAKAIAHKTQYQIAAE